MYMENKTKSLRSSQQMLCNSHMLHFSTFCTSIHVTVCFSNLFQFLYSQLIVLQHFIQVILMTTYTISNVLSSFCECGNRLVQDIITTMQVQPFLYLVLFSYSHTFVIWLFGWLSYSDVWHRHLCQLICINTPLWCTPIHFSSTYSMTGQAMQLPLCKRKVNVFDPHKQKLAQGVTH